MLSAKLAQTAYDYHLRWQKLCEEFLPVKTVGSLWRYSRLSLPSEPKQGWKLHISATILEACDLFEKVASFLKNQDIRFKAPATLQELLKINCGLQYGYSQVGKFITVYPSDEKSAVYLADKLHQLTLGFKSVSVPFDAPFLPNSSVFYRYGGFEKIKNEQGIFVNAVVDNENKLVPDDRLRPVPEWIQNPFANKTTPLVKSGNLQQKTPLTTQFKVFHALTQRGKGGTYFALDIRGKKLLPCVVKEGRRYGEMFWNGQDGFSLVKNEFFVLRALNKINEKVPRVITSFEADGNFYLVLELVEGKSLFDLMKFRRRRFSINQIATLSGEIAEIIAEFHESGWVWNDCKPANLVVTKEKKLRPIDFENAHRLNNASRFEWRSKAFSKPFDKKSSGETKDLYALGTVIYFMLTGKFYNPDAPVRINNIRRNVPLEIINIVEKLLLTEKSPETISAAQAAIFFKSFSAKHQMSQTE